MSDDRDLSDMFDQLSLAQKIVLAQGLSLAVSVDVAKRAAVSPQGAVAFSQPFTLGDRREGRKAAERIAGIMNRAPAQDGEA